MRLPSILGSPGVGVPVYATLGEIGQRFDLGSGSSKITFHRNGTRENITRADGTAFITYLRRTLGFNGFVTMMESIIMHNAAAWDAQS
ncbi:MAG: hypothetical protein HGA19_24880 [Oscillochloris sp.]|nr:hypothetical protein [Oscillochloris sp.]